MVSTPFVIQDIDYFKYFKLNLEIQHFLDQDKGLISSGALLRFLSNSPNPESAHQRYSSSDRSSLQATSSGAEQTRRLYTDRAVETVCQKYTDRSTGSPASADFGRYSGFPEVGASQTRYVSSNDRFNDLALQRCGQSRSSADRFSSDRYLGGSSPAHDGRLSSGETPRYIVSSTERLLAPTSSSPSSSSETGKCEPSFPAREGRRMSWRMRDGNLSMTQICAR